MTPGALHSMRCIPTYARVSVHGLVNFRMGLIIRLTTAVMSAVIGLFIWSAVADARGGSVGSYTAPDFVTYFLVALLMHYFVSTDLPWHVSSNVRDGRLATYLLRPAHAITYYIGYDLSYRVIQLPILVPVALLLHATFDGSELPGATTWLAFAVLVIGAYTTRLALEGLVACATLPLVRTEGLIRVTYTVAMFMGGQFVPIGLLPDPIAAIARALPFYWSFGYPVELATGVDGGSSVRTGLAMLALWTVVLGVAFHFAWRRGLRAHESVGQ